MDPHSPEPTPKRIPSAQINPLDSIRLLHSINDNSIHSNLITTMSHVSVIVKQQNTYILSQAMKVLLPLRHQFLQREFLVSAPQVCFFAIVRTNVIRELTQAEVVKEVKASYLFNYLLFLGARKQ